MSHTSYVSYKSYVFWPPTLCATRLGTALVFRSSTLYLFLADNICLARD